MSDLEFRREAVSRARRVVIKIGSSVLTHHRDIIDLHAIESLAGEMSDIIDGGKEIVIVTSGAIAAGSRKLGLRGRPKNIPEKQAAAAAGQSVLIRHYEKAFEKSEKKVAQILLTGDGLSERSRYLNARNTIFSLLHYSVIPIINENDSVVVDEIRFGDNDNLSAMVTGLVDADLLIILTDTEGLYDRDPRRFEDARLIHAVNDFDMQTRGAADTASGVGTGGMVTKIEAARRAATFGVPTIIANGEKKGVLLDIMESGEVGTLFIPGDEKLKGKKRWIAYSLKVSGRIVVDGGARRAVEGGKSLLPSGVVAVEGDFDFGDLVSVAEESGGEFARGLALFSSGEIGAMKGLKTAEIEKVLGKKDYDEIIHRDDLVVL